MKKTFGRNGLIAAITVAAASARAWAGAIGVPMQSAAAAGQADAFTAQADDASAIFYNPAGLTQLSGTNASVGAYYLQPDFHFRGDDGQGERNTLPTILPHVYAETDFGIPRFRAGIGVNNVFGINEDYGDKGPLRLIDDKARLAVINIAPSVAYQVTDQLSVGAALNVYYGDLDLRRNVLLGAGAPEGHFRLRGSDTAIGVTPGILYKIDDRNTIGAYYRSPFTLDFNGRARVRIPGGPQVASAKANESLDFPEEIGVGYAIRPVKKLKVEADVIWTDWNSTDQLRIESPNPLFNGQTLKADWKSGFTYRLGAQYQLDPHWVVRGGYAFGDNAVPGSTFSPIVPDSQYHLFAVGVGYVADQWTLDLAYQYILRQQRHIENSVDSPIVNGTWDNNIQGLMLTFSYHI